MVTENKRLKSAYDTAANWTSGNPTLLPGEIGIESDTKNVKVGDGSTSWTSLNYSSIGVTAYDSSLGRLAIGGIEMGDTGWRNVTASQENSWAAAILLIRRVDSVVFLMFSAANTASSSATSDTFYTASSGFRQNITSLIDTPVIHGNSTVIYARAQSTGALSLPGKSGSALAGSLYFIIQWPTTEAWPSSLPGTAA